MINGRQQRSSAYTVKTPNKGQAPILSSGFTLVFIGRQAGMNLREMLLTQCRVLVGVLNPSPLNICPKCPPQAAHVISVRLPSGLASVEN